MSHNHKLCDNEISDKNKIRLNCCNVVFNHNINTIRTMKYALASSSYNLTENKTRFPHYTL